MAYEGVITETLSINGDKNEPISAYVARPLGRGPFPGIVLIHHAPGWDEWYRETTRKFAHHGYATISHNLYHRASEGKADDAAKVRAEGGVPDAQVIGDRALSPLIVRNLPSCLHERSMRRRSTEERRIGSRSASTGNANS